MKLQVPSSKFQIRRTTEIQQNCSAGFQTCCIADFQVGQRICLRTVRGFGNPRHSRLGSLRYDLSRQLELGIWSLPK